MTGKPTVSELGIDLGAQVWQRSGRGDGAVEIAFARATAPESKDGRWVLMRVTGDPEQRVLVFDRHEWECFLDGARNGEFDDAAPAGLDRSRSDGSDGSGGPAGSGGSDGSGGPAGSRNGEHAGRDSASI